MRENPREKARLLKFKPLSKGLVWIVSLMLAAGGCHKPQPQGADGGASLKEARLWIIQQGQGSSPFVGV